MVLLCSMEEFSSFDDRSYYYSMIVYWIMKDIPTRL